MAADPSQTPTTPQAESTSPEALIQPNAPEYPAYVVEFAGNAVPDSPRRASGPHTFGLLPGTGSATITVSLARNPTEPGVPNLRLEISQK